jgi:hypothetical protein
LHSRFQSYDLAQSEKFSFWTLSDEEIFNVIEREERKSRNEANMSSYTAAMGWAGIFNSLGGKTSKKLSALDFLPYPDELAAKNKISPATARALLDALKEDKLRPKYIGLLSSVIQEAIEIVKK